ncbi:group II intron reverse transcriptase/maturase [Amycolatopsis sp. H20-H5]|uniref:group II intron reverse transcriptase/maturase n=1 Tax=Amycolatopsis sp. H20-H5 TaxID=3046309 RepID=UPI002DBD044D|nr:group II intron reverse transcriptase/maturase [Amycolatopsis sp. H20-H5]MEC3982811.1 group II intron reverse transcriptase/maturase [Amycolatopsis sp. H20-H5]
MAMPETTVVADGDGVVNGPEGRSLDWDAVEWRTVEDEVRRLRQRIFAASQAGDQKKVRNLQKLMLRSRSNALVSVRRVTEVNAGRKTAGVDGVVVVTPEQKADLADWVTRRAEPWSPRPVKRVYVPKSNGRRRPLGIPVIADRCLQALTVNALEPEWEARFEPKSYGFRPGRGCHDAIVAIHTTASRTDAKRLWVLDADLEAAFDRLNHDHICESLGTFPARELVRQWLRAGVVEDGRFAPTGEGAPQGGVISPLLMNVALHGLEAAAGVRYHLTGTRAGKTMSGCPTVVRYADDLVALCHSREQAEQVKARLTEWLVPRGLVFNEDKTQITHLDEGVDFLGFTIRRFRGRKLLTKPSDDALRRIRARLSTEAKALRGANADVVIAKLNPIIAGWAAYYRIGVSKRAFNALDAHVWKLVYKWARFTHPNKPTRWVTARYFGTFNPARADKWVFGSRVTGFYLRKFAWAAIVRHRMVAGAASPDDPSLTDYWATRRHRGKPPVGKTTLRLLQAQRWRCSLCRGLLLHAEREPQSPREWEQWLAATRKAVRKHAVTVWGAGTSDERVADRLIHAHCQRRIVGDGNEYSTSGCP